MIFFQFNPELARQILQEFSPVKMVLPPVVIGTLVVVLGIIAPDKVDDAMQLLLLPVLFFWGTRITTATVASEVRLNRWDLLRLSALKPITVWFGKLFGSTSYVWYVAIILASGYYVSAADKIEAIIFLFLAGLLSHIWGMFLGLLLMRLQISKRRIQVVFAQSLAVFLGVIFYLNYDKLGDRHLFSFWGYTVTSLNFYWAAQIFLCFWGAVAALRLIREQLQYRSYPIYWCLFLASVVLFIMGLSVTDRQYHLLSSYAGPIFDVPAFEFGQLSFVFKLVAVGFLMIFFAYVSAFFDLKNRIRLVKFGTALKQKNYKKSAEFLPICLVPILLTFIAFTGAYYYVDNYFSGALNLLSASLKKVISVTLLGQYGALYILYMIRDVLVLYGLVLMPQIVWGHLAFILYLVGAYFIVPFMISFLSEPLAQSLFYPTIELSAVVSFSSILVQLVFVCFFLRYVKRFGDQLMENLPHKKSV